MDALTVPRTLAGLQYKALRYPSQLIEQQLVAARLPETSGVRLAFERALGTVDSLAGRLLRDDVLAHRGRALRRHAEVVEKAVSLEQKAAQRKAEADAALRKQTQQAEEQKARVQAEHEQEAARLKAERDAEQAAIERKAAARKRADASAITSKTEALLAAERDQLDAQESKIEARVETAAAAPKAKLRKAADKVQGAADKKVEADALAMLAQREKASRSA
jgi:hypothetical protein